MQAPQFDPYIEISQHYLDQIAGLWCRHYAIRDRLNSGNQKKLLAILTEIFRDVSPIDANLAWDTPFSEKTIIGLVSEAIRIEREDVCSSFHARASSLEKAGLPPEATDPSSEAYDETQDNADKLLLEIVKACKHYLKTGAFPYGKK